MALVTCSGADLLRGSVHMPLRGAWSAELELDTAIAPTGKVTIEAADGVTLKGFVAVGAVFLDVAHITVVGGAGGLGKILDPAAFENAQLRDPLNAIMRASGETLSSSIAPSILGALLPTWTITGTKAARALDELCYAASQASGEAVGWRVLDDGTIWIGSETWPSESLPEGSDLIDVSPADGRYVIGAQTPTLLPGIHLSDVDANIAGVDHFIEPASVRTFAWT